MPYQNSAGSFERASKTSHADIVRNPDVSDFLRECEHLRPPSPEEGAELAARFQEPPSIEELTLPSMVIAVDGSATERSIDDQLPSTKVGYVKVSATLIDMAQFNNLRVWEGRFVDPCRVAALENNNSSLTFALPSANVRWRGMQTVRQSFRAYLDACLYGTNTRFKPDDPTTSLRTTLFHLAHRRPNEMATSSPAELSLHRCPNDGCDARKLILRDVPDQQHCPRCNGPVFPSDCLRIWEAVEEFQANGEAINRAMNTIEHLMPIHYIRYLADNSLASLGTTAFFVDGPLAVFGNSAWLHGSIMRFASEINDRLTAARLPRILMIGLQKTGAVVDHAGLLSRFLPNNRVFCIDDAYRYRYILSGREDAGNGFGYETYYGQDFIFKTESGRVFVFGIPYTFPTKHSEGVDFRTAKSEIDRYDSLPQALALIQHFESDLYQNAVIPIALAHRYTAISLVPGGRVLDLFTSRGLTR